MQEYIRPNFVIVTGLSGAGKSQVMKCFEDQNYYCVDNLPPVLIPDLIKLCHNCGIFYLAIALDVRNKDFFADLTPVLKQVEEMGQTPYIVFLEASDDVLIHRYAESRRQHPLAPNAFVWNPWDTGGGAFEEPINTSERAKEPEYRVSPFIGTSATRSTALAGYGAALLFDIDNHRFVAWDGDRVAALKQTLYPLTDPSNKMFSFNTGNMDLLAMVGTQFSNGAVYCFMQDGSKRHIYSVNTSDKTFKQEGCWTNINKPDFDKATLFTAHSQYQTVYYAYQNKVYAYNLGSGVCNLAVTLPANEEVTLIKFCTYDNPGGIGTLTKKMDEETANKFVARQYKLIVASYDNSVADGNGGKVRFYETSSPGTTLTLGSEGEFEGFGRIKDIAYKEVRP